MATVAGDGSELPNPQVILKRYVTGFPSEDDMELVTGTAHHAVPPGSTAVVLKNLYLSCNPYMRGGMTKHKEPGNVFPDFVPGKVLSSYGVSKVVESGHRGFKFGDLVWGTTGWEEYTLVPNPESLLRINRPEILLSYYTGVLGVLGLTAYVGLFKMAKPKKGEAALGAVGQIRGQLAKLTGCYV